MLFLMIKPFELLQANNLPINILPISYSGQSSQISVYDFPKNVIVNLNQGSAIKSMDFHPSQMSLLLGELLLP